MIARMHRFHGFNSLRYVYTHGQTIRAPQLSIKYIFNNKRQNYRVAVVVSRKVHKSAVVRNRIRRRLYEIVRSHASEISQPVDMVITVFSEHMANMEAQLLESMVVEQLNRAHILSTSPKVDGHAIVEPRQSKERS